MCSYLDIAKRVTLANTQGSSRADREWDRFLSVAVETPDGNGLYDPIHGAPEMPHGVDDEAWRRLEHDFAHLGKRGES